MSIRSSMSGNDTAVVATMDPGNVQTRSGVLVIV